MNNDIKDIIKFTQEIKPKLINFKKIFSFNSKDNCKNKILVLSNFSKKNMYTYISEAIDNGIIGLVITTDIDFNLLKKNIPVLRSKYLNGNLNIFLDYLYNHPLQNKKIIGVTGTDGKTSTCHLIADSLTALGKKVGIVSTAGNGIYPRLKNIGYTTPRSDLLYKEFDSFNIKKVDIIIIECSSQGLHQGRLNHIVFNNSIVTNLNKDHIEYHKTFKNYAKSKQKLIDMTIGNIFINIDCKNSISKLGNIKKSKTILYGSNIDEKIIHNLIDTSNALENNFTKSNRSLLYRFFLNMDYSLNKIKSILNKKPKVIKGRMNYFNDKKNNAIYVIDYAHTEHALEILLRDIKIQSGKLFLITLFGCGGNRDINKRSGMGTIANKYSDKIILTDDNPRNEDSMNIINDIHKKIKNKSNIYIIPNRKKAIRKALSMSTKDTVIVFAGKGNEDNIIYNDKVIGHNDINYLTKLLK
jgi:UDP-N-acetylmuramoyl-L-alanyl-D-glutamate--2,6-diaminopimelate ligase